MSKQIRKFLFGDLYNIQEYEEYFSDMSRMGFHLQRVGKYFAYFKEDKPQHLNYRIDVVKTDKKETTIIKRKTKGWNFICERDLFLIFSSPEDSSLKELYETPEEQRLEIKAVKERFFGKKITNIIVAIVAIIGIIAALHAKVIRNRFYLTLNDLSFYKLIITSFITFLVGRDGRKSLERAEKILGNNEYLSHQGDYLLMKSKFIVRRFIYFSLILFIAGNIFNQALQNESVSLNEIKNLEELPIVTVESIENTNYKRDRKSLSRDNDTDSGNTIYKSWSLFIPEEYELVEVVKLNDQNSGIIEFKQQLIVDYYLSRFDFIASGLESDILYRENIRRSLGLGQIQKGERLSVYGVDRDNEIILLCRHGKQVVYIRYSNGTVSLEELAEMVVNKMESNE